MSELIKGVHVLYQYPQGVNWYMAILCGITFAIALFLLGSVIHTLITTHKAYITGTAFIISGILLCFVIYLGIKEEFVNQNVPVYQVIIDDDVSFKEFDRNFKIKCVVGEIYTIVRKDSVQ